MQKSGSNNPAGSLSIGSDANDVLVEYSPAPEPSSLAFLAATAGALTLRRRRRATA